MDDIDRAQEREEMDRATAIRAARVAVALPDTGLCYWCEDPVPAGAHFCNCECREDYDRHEKSRRRNGVAE